MKPSSILIIALVAPAIAAVCPYAALREFGLLSRDDTEKVDIVPGCYKMHDNGGDRSKRQLGGLLGGLLKLGGGLCKSFRMM